MLKWLFQIVPKINFHIHIILLWVDLDCPQVAHPTSLTLLKQDRVIKKYGKKFMGQDEVKGVHSPVTVMERKRLSLGKLI